MKPNHLASIGARDVGSIKLDDFFASPPEAVDALCSVERFDGDIWEPACGNGAISSVLERRGYKVHSSDLVNRGYGRDRIDFLMEREPWAANIVTNPPYKLGEDFARHALTLTTGKVAFLMRLVWLEGQARRSLFSDPRFARVWVFSKRLPRMHRPDFQGERTTSTIAFAWFVWDHAHSGPPNLGWI